MTIKKIKQQLEESNHPVAMSLHSNKNFKVLAMGFKKGMVLKEHKAHSYTKLTILEGEVIYSEGDTNTVLKQYEEYVIPIDITHSVKANDDSICLLTQERN